MLRGRESELEGGRDPLSQLFSLPHRISAAAAADRGVLLSYHYYYVLRKKASLRQGMSQWCEMGWKEDEKRENEALLPITAATAPADEGFVYSVPR